MNEMKNLEMLLRSWTPRRPSQKIEERLFRPTPAEPERAPSFRFAWLAPSAAALVLVGLLIFDRTPQGLNVGTVRYPIVAMVSSNLSSPSSLIALPVSNVEHNSIRVPEQPTTAILINYSAPGTNL